MFVRPRLAPRRFRLGRTDRHPRRPTRRGSEALGSRGRSSDRLGPPLPRTGNDGVYEFAARGRLSAVSPDPRRRFGLRLHRMLQHDRRFIFARRSHRGEPREICDRGRVGNRNRRPRAGLPRDDSRHRRGFGVASTPRRRTAKKRLHNARRSQRPRGVRCNQSSASRSRADEFPTLGR